MHKSKYRVVTLATTKLSWLQSLLQKLHIKLHKQTSILWCDNTVAQAMSYDVVFHLCTKHIEIDMHFVRDKVEAKELDVRFDPTDYQIADVLAKYLFINRFCSLRSKLALVIPLCSLRRCIEQNSSKESQGQTC